MENFNDWDELKDYAVPGFSEQMPDMEWRDMLEKILRNTDLYKVISETAKEEIYNREFELLHNEDEPDPNEKIKLNGSIQMWGYLFGELMSKGFMAPVYKGEKLSPTNTAVLLLKHFEFTANQNQPSKDMLRKAISSDNALAESKKEAFKIPLLKNLD